MAEIEIRLTQAQASALECGCWDVVEGFWSGDRLRFSRSDAPRIIGDLIQGANSEDTVAEIRRAQGEHELARQARGARTALENLVDAVAAAGRRGAA